MSCANAMPSVATRNLARLRLVLTSFNKKSGQVCRKALEPNQIEKQPLSIVEEFEQASLIMLESYLTISRIKEGNPEERASIHPTTP